MTTLLFTLILSAHAHAQTNLIDDLAGGVRLALRLRSTPEAPAPVVSITPLGPEREFYARREALRREVDDLKILERRLTRDQARLSAIAGTSDARGRATDALATIREALEDARRARERAEQAVTRATDAVRTAARAVDQAERAHWQCSVFHAWCDSYGDAVQPRRVSADERLAAAEEELTGRRRAQDQLEQEYFTTKRELQTLSDLSLQNNPYTETQLANARRQLARTGEVLAAKRDELKALNGFYTFSRATWPAAIDAPFCQTAYAYHRALDDERHPFFAEPVPSDERDFDHGPLLACVDDHDRLTSVRAFDPNLLPIAYSEVVYADDGTVARVVIKDRLGKVIESR